MKTPGFVIKNDTIWPLQISLNQVGPLYFDVIQPGEYFVKDTGAVWFTIKASIFLDEKTRITDWDAVLPVAEIVGTVILAAVTAGAAAYAAGPALAAAGAAGVSGVTGLSSAGALATATAASTLVGAGFSATSALVIGGVVVGGTGAALTSTATAALTDIFKTENISVSKPGCYAGEPFPFETEITPWRITGGPTYRKGPGESQVDVVGCPLIIEQIGMISGGSDEALLNKIGATSYQDQTKKKLIKNIRDKDADLTEAKSRYGDGVCVKGMLVNVSGYSFLTRISLSSETGKSWSDNQCKIPDGSAGPLDACNFFHAKADAAAKGCRAGFTYRVLDKDSVIQGIISIAWQNPYVGDFVYCVMVSKNQDLLQTCLDYCDQSSESKIGSDETVKIGSNSLNEFITVDVESAHTAYLFISMKTDEMVKEIFGIG